MQQLIFAPNVLKFQTFDADMWTTFTSYILSLTLLMLYLFRKVKTP